MARKTTYLYRVYMNKRNGVGITDYCYARNQQKAIEGFKQVYAEKKYDNFKAVCFAEADYEQHPDYFERMTAQEIKLIEEKNIASADKYSRRKQIPQNATFVSKEDLEKVLQE